MDKLHIAIVGSANMIPSLKAHIFLEQKGYNVKSYSVEEGFKLPVDMEPEQLDCYDFGVSYEFIIKDLERKCAEYTEMSKIFYHKMNTQSHPHKFHDNDEIFNIIITCEKVVYQEVVEWFENRVSFDSTEHPVYVVNMDIKKADIGSIWISDLLTLLVQSNNFEEEGIFIIDRYLRIIKQQPPLRSKLYY